MRIENAGPRLPFLSVLPRIYTVLHLGQEIDTSIHRALDRSTIYNRGRISEE